MEKKRILVVDDSEIVLLMAREALEDGGYEVCTALNAMEANGTIFGSNRPDLIILDVMLPMMDGDKKARILKGDPRTCDIPILLLSSKPDDELRRITLGCGADGFLRKPFANRQMIAKVQETLGEVNAA